MPELFKGCRGHGLGGPCSGEEANPSRGTRSLFRYAAFSPRLNSTGFFIPAGTFECTEKCLDDVSGGVATILAIPGRPKEVEPQRRPTYVILFSQWRHVAGIAWPDQFFKQYGYFRPVADKCMFWIMVVTVAQLYRNEHELLRELAQVDAALDDYDRRAEVRSRCVRRRGSATLFAGDVNLFDDGQGSPPSSNIPLLQPQGHEPSAKLEQTPPWREGEARG